MHNEQYKEDRSAAMTWTTSTSQLTKWNSSLRLLLSPKLLDSL
jgi:hypothetical protein